MRSSLRWLAGTSAFGLTVLALSADVDAGGCLKDTDCKGTRICQQGQCVEPTKVDPTKKACTKDTDCPGDEICTNKACGKAGAPPASATPPASSAPPPGSAPSAAPPPPPPPTEPSSYPPGTLPTSSPPPSSYPPAGTPPAGSYPPPSSYPPGAYPPGANPPVGPQGYGYPPPPDAQGEPGGATEYRSKGLMIAGAVLLPVGFVALMAGAIGGAVSAAESSTNYYGYYYDDTDDDFPAAAAAPIVLGGVAMITGIIFLSIGAPKVPVEAQPAAARRAPPVTITPLVGPASAALRLSF